MPCSLVNTWAATVLGLVRDRWRWWGWLVGDDGLAEAEAEATRRVFGAMVTFFMSVFGVVLVADCWSGCDLVYPSVPVLVCCLCFIDHLITTHSPHYPLSGMTAGDSTICAMIKDHCVQLRSKPAFRRALFVFFLEANMSYVATNRLNAMLDVPAIQPVHVERDRKNPARFGIWTGQAEKEAYVDRMVDALVDNSLCFAKNMVGQNLAKDRGDLLKQMSKFRREVKPPSDFMFGTAKVAYSGKSSSQKDDLILAVQIALFWGHNKRIDSRFVDFCSSKGWSVY